MELQEFKDLLYIAIQASLEAGEEIMEVYESGDPETQLKEDRSPLTQADLRSNAVINSYLEQSGFPILSEEGADIPYHDRKDWINFWMIDPLDGTKEFIKRNGEFTVNIAFIHDNSPVMGVIFTPVQKILYFGAKDLGAYRLVLSDRGVQADLDKCISKADRLPFRKSGEVVKVVGSRSHMSQETLEFIDNLKFKYQKLEIVSKGSSLKICLVAEGTAQYYPRLGPTMEWDTAAGQAIAEAAGCTMLQYNSDNPVVYNKEELLNPWFVVKS